MEDTSTYVYCLVHGAGPVAARNMPPGIPGATPPTLVNVAPGLSMVTSEVPGAMYAPGEVERRLRDLDWVAEIALAHELVVERLSRARGATVMPLKLFTMFSGPERAVAEMRTRRRQLEAVVKRIRGCDEWGVRVTRKAPAPAAPVRPAVRSGAVFLAAKKLARDEAREQTARLGDAADEVLVRLGRIAKQAKRRPVPESAANPPLLEAVFLVPHGRKARFRTAAREAAVRCRAVGAELTLTGPWPAYNFVGPGEARS